MIYLRSALFQLAFYLVTAAAAVMFIPALAAPRRITVWGMEQWSAATCRLLVWLAGIRLQVRGREHLPQGAAIVASKHQSAFDTIVFHRLLDDPAIVMKRELTRIPVYGWLARKAEMIAVDRKAGARALRRLVRDGAAAAAAGRPIVIFPEGTRTRPGQRLPYQPGIDALYKHLQLPVVPVAVNSGLCWPRRTFLKYPGTIVIEALPPIPPGLPRAEFSRRLQSAIEEASERLLQASEGACGQSVPSPLKPGDER